MVTGVVFVLASERIAQGSVCEHSMQTLRKELLAHGIQLPSDCNSVMHAVFAQKHADYLKRVYP
jgi:hypothetical protein